MKKLPKLNKKIIIFIVSLTRITGVVAFLYFHPFIAYFFNALFDMADGPIYKHVLILNPVKAQVIDKTFDLWLFTAAVAYTIVNYRPLVTPLLIFLFVYRLIGQLVFFITKNKRLFVYFPNLFENMFFSFYFLDLISANYLLKDPLFFRINVILWGSSKIIHENSLHRRNETIFDDIILPTFQKIKKLTNKNVYLRLRPASTRGEPASRRSGT